MLTIRVSWSAQRGEWLVSPLDGTPLSSSEGLTLSQWADDQPDLTPVRLVLSAMNYSCHWVNLPGVSGRNLQRALPFALEESLVEDLDHYQIVAAGKTKNLVRAYVANADLIERLLESCKAHHLLVRQLIPETALLPKTHCMVRDGHDWLLSLPGRLEGRVMDVALTPVLESVLDEQQTESALDIRASAMDQARLLETSLETGFPGAFTDIQTTLDSADSVLQQGLEQSGLPNFLTGQFQPRNDASDGKPNAWWRPLAALAAVWLVLSAGYLMVQNHQLKAQTLEVQKQSVALYKQLFPGERIRMLERQFRAKMAESGQTTAIGFVSLVNGTAQAYSSSGLKSLKITSVRYNDRLQELMVEVAASKLSDVQALRQSLEKQGLKAEVASASNDKNGVKGRLKIGASA